MKRFFTLIELLVVIAIIAIRRHAAPAGGQEKARAGVMPVNCKQLALTLMLYADDYGDRLLRHTT